MSCFSFLRPGSPPVLSLTPRFSPRKPQNAIACIPPTSLHTQLCHIFTPAPRTLTKRPPNCNRVRHARPDAYLSGLSSRQHPALSKPLTALIPSQSSAMPPDVPVRGAITRSPKRGALQVLAVHCLTLPKPAPAEPVMPCGGALPAAIGFAVALANIVRAVPQARARARKRCQFPTRVVYYLFPSFICVSMLSEE